MQLQNLVVRFCKKRGQTWTQLEQHQAQQEHIVPAQAGHTDHLVLPRPPLQHDPDYRRVNKTLLKQSNVIHLIFVLWRKVKCILVGTRDCASMKKGDLG